MYPLDISRGHDRPELGKVLVHELSAVALNGNVSHPLVLHLLLVLATPRPPPLLLLRYHHLLLPILPAVGDGANAIAFAILHQIQPPPINITLQQQIAEVIATQVLQATTKDVVLWEHHCL